MKKQNYEVEILVNGKPVKEYFKNPKVYIEGREGNDFSIRIKNNGYKRIVAIPSVDGLSVLDGKEASHNSQGYIISGHDSMTIDGWRISDDEVKLFYFTNPEDSYAERKDEGDNLGVIGVAIFREKDAPIIYNYNVHHFGCECNQCQPFKFPKCPTYPYVIGNEPNIMMCSSKVENASLSADNTRGAKNFSSQELGTGWGETKSDSVTTVSFDREDKVDATFNVFYNTREQLKKLGINFGRREKYIEPSAFPGTYCEEPKN